MPADLYVQLMLREALRPGRRDGASRRGRVEEDRHERALAAALQVIDLRAPDAS
jgi:hypothetical protein